MAIEIIINDGNTQYVSLEHGNTLKMCIDQIQMLLFTVPGEVQGDPLYGVDLKKYLWELKFSGQDMKNYITKQINKYVLYSNIYSITVEVKLVQGDLEDSAFIDILIDGVPVIGVNVK